MFFDWKIMTVSNADALPLDSRTTELCEAAE